MPLVVTFVIDFLIVILVAAIVIRIIQSRKRLFVSQVNQARDTLDALSQAVFRIDATGQVHYMNPAARRMLNLPGDKLPETLELISHSSRQPLLPLLQSNPEEPEEASLPEDARLITQQGVELEVEGSCRFVRGEDGHILVNILQLQDVTEEREWIRRQPDLWDRDLLTALPGRNFMINRLTRLLERERAGERPFSYLHIKLDGVQDVYNKAGTKAGDTLIRHLTALIRSQFRDTDLLARMDTESFGALLTVCPESVAEKIRTNILSCLTASHFPWQDKTYQIGVHIGEVRTPPFEGTFEELLAIATRDHE